MSMRSLCRAVARYRMKVCGYERLNKKMFQKKEDKKALYHSCFAVNWRKFLDPSSKQYQSFQRVLKRQENNRRKASALMQAITDRRAARKQSKGVLN